METAEAALLTIMYISSNLYLVIRVLWMIYQQFKMMRKGRIIHLNRARYLTALCQFWCWNINKLAKGSIKWERQLSLRQQVM